MIITKISNQLFQKVHKVLKINYQDIVSIDNLKEGLNRIKFKPSLVSNKVTHVNFTDKKLNQLHEELKSQKFKPSPMRKIVLSRNLNQFLTIASSKDQITQAALLNVLEPLLEKVFLDCSFGNRTNLNCHDALKVVKTKWHNITWIIKINFQKCFNKVNQNHLLQILQDYCDQATTELIGKLIRCGYINFYNSPNIFEHGCTEIYQNSLISPILSNLYLHALDRYICEELSSKWNCKTVGNFFKKKIVGSENKLIKNLETFKKNNFRCMYYSRYSEDFIVGFTGTRLEAESIRIEIEKFLINKLFLKVNNDTSYITHFSSRKINYLGFYLRCTAINNTIKDSKQLRKNLRNSFRLKPIVLNRVQLRIPVEVILRRAVDRNYAKLRNGGKSIRATSCRKLCFLEDRLIVQKFSDIIKKLMIYYRPANKYSDLWKIIALYRKSCALTLADKHKLKTAAAVFKKYGPNLKILDSLKKKEVTLFYPISLKTTINFKLGVSSISLVNIIF